MEIDASLVRDLVAAQFPAWAGLPVEPVEPGGWDNRTFRLGADLSVRLPSHERYAAQVEKERTWLPKLAPSLPLPIPTPVARGTPAPGYPWEWSVYRWLEGEAATVGTVDDLGRFAADLGGFLKALHAADSGGGPEPGAHNFHRGGSLSVYDAETRVALQALEGRMDVGPCTEVWDAALRSSGRGEPIWVHGDMAATNLLVRDGALSAVIDFGCCGVGDPACDLVIAWTFFTGPSRETFRSRVSVDDATWARARGWALWKALTSLAREPTSESPSSRRAKGVIDAVVAEHLL